MTRNFYRSAGLGLLSITLATGAAVAGSHEQAVKKTEAKAMDIVDTAVAAGNFKTLAKALGAAGLVETLKGAGPFTVFAPTDEAFAKLPAGKLDELLKDPAALKSVLAYHVVPGKLMAADVAKLAEAKTVQGSSLKIDTTSGVTVGGAKVVKTDIACSNGIIHVVDSVILPH